MQDTENTFRHGKLRVLGVTEIHNLAALDAPEMPVLHNIGIKPHLAVPDEDFLRCAFFTEQFQRLINRATGECRERRMKPFVNHLGSRMETIFKKERHYRYPLQGYPYPVSNKQFHSITSHLASFLSVFLANRTPVPFEH